MRLRFSSKLSVGYFEALLLHCKKQPEMWKVFCRALPTFSDVPVRKLRIILKGIKTHYKYRRIIINSRLQYEILWDSYADRVERALERVFGYRLDLDIHAYVCITPLFTRNIRRRFFLIPTNSTSRRIAEIIIHELSHFYFYYHPDISQAGLDDNNAWMLSEYIVDDILPLFPDLCDVGESYLPPCSDEIKALIERWVNHECEFSEMLRIFNEKVGE